jgi:BirA family transcriptional regulator, biotin operon repressor / biotin---[acetyl-CoA-carboxylase] ligase
MRLDPAVAASGVKLVTREEVGSTNTEALALWRAGETGPLWVVARRQSAGRGRRGRTWVSESGNLYASLLLTDPSPPSRAPELSFVAALAVHDAVAAFLPTIGARLALKWPNDLLIGGKKFCGILIEGEGAAVVIGIGVNCVHHPKEAAFPATDLGASGVSVTVEKVFDKIAGAMVQRIAQWNRGENFDAIRADWLVRAVGVGGTIRVQTPDGERVGRFETLDAGGCLVLKLPNGATETITAGDVSVSNQGRVAAAGR